MIILLRPLAMAWEKGYDGFHGLDLGKDLELGLKTPRRGANGRGLVRDSSS